ncbi:MAG: hypothetical protein SCALA702_25000 [Melioribacteraceae bacterium]|nr:MAG: hypothetical protein SCALA702_25000 [Melioribacteraceae bacterium]
MDILFLLNNAVRALAISHFTDPGAPKTEFCVMLTILGLDGSFNNTARMAEVSIIISICTRTIVRII